MRKINGGSIVVFLICWVFATWGVESISAQASEGKLSKSRYVDPKGYFKIVPPDGWRMQDFPQDTRGKVAFFAPESDVDLRVLVNAVDFSTIEELISYCKDVERRIGVSTNIGKTTFGDRPAVKRSFQFKGLKLYYIDFLVGKVDHNIAYSASPSKYDKYLPIVQKSMETYETVMRDISDKEVVKNLVAKKVRLTQLMIEMGNFDLAMEFVKEGLQASPNDAELLQLRKQIENKRKK